jgi:RNA polymerase sigma factor (sigma-70 family)
MNRERRKPLTPEQQQLVTRYERFPSFVVDKYFWNRGYRTLERKEMLGVAVVALVHAAARYDPAVGVKFTTFAALAIQRKVLAAIDRTKNNRCRITYQHKSLEHIKVNPPDRRHSDCTSIDDLDAMRKVRTLLGQEEYELALAHFGHGETLLSLGRQRGVTREAVRQRLARLSEYVRRQLPDLEYAT